MNTLGTDPTTSTETGVLEPVIISAAPEAKAKLKDLRFTADEIGRRLFESDLRTGAALYCRLYEKANKLAMLYAISENPTQPMMTAAAVDWAKAFAMHITKKMVYESQFNVAEGKFDRLKKRFLSIIARHGGKLDHSSLLRYLSIDATLFKRLVMTLKMCDMIEDEELTGGKRGYLLKRVA